MPRRDVPVLRTYRMIFPPRRSPALTDRAISCRASGPITCRSPFPFANAASRSICRRRM